MILNTLFFFIIKSRMSVMVTLIKQQFIRNIKFAYAIPQHQEGKAINRDGKSDIMFIIQKEFKIIPRTC